MSRPLPAPTPVPTMTAVGVARPSAHGHATTTTLIALRKAVKPLPSPLSPPSWPKMHHPRKVHRERNITKGANLEATSSANFCAERAKRIRIEWNNVSSVATPTLVAASEASQQHLH